jgi:hypothetical protein
VRLVAMTFCVAWETNRYSVPPRFVGHSANLRVLEGVLEVFIGDEVITAAPRARHEAQALHPAVHEAQFRESSTSRHVLREQFLRIGPPPETSRMASSSSIAALLATTSPRILGLAERVGTPRVAEALRHAVRYGAFNYNAVARIVEGKSDMPLVAPSPAGPLPERIHEYLRGVGEHQRPLRAYQQLLDKLSNKEPDNGK